MIKLGISTFSDPPKEFKEWLAHQPLRFRFLFAIGAIPFCLFCVSILIALSFRAKELFLDSSPLVLIGTLIFCVLTFSCAIYPMQLEHRYKNERENDRKSGNARRH